MSELYIAPTDWDASEGAKIAVSKIIREARSTLCEIKESSHPFM